MSKRRSIFALGLVAATMAMAPPARSQNDIARCLHLAAICERHVAKNNAAALPSMSVQMSVAIEGCREGKLDSAVEMLEAALRAKKFRL